LYLTGIFINILQNLVIDKMWNRILSQSRDKYDW